ncbi:hypothetical protein Tco_0760744 [Tanacetum coccineum]
MRELREDTFSKNKNDDAYDHVKRILDIISLFNILGVTYDVVMLRVFPINLTKAAKRYCRPSKITKQLEEIYNFKQEADETLYQALEMYNDLLYKCLTHDLNSYQKGPIPNKKHAQALTAIQTLDDHLQKWHDGSTSGRVSNDSSDEMATITNKLDGLGRDMKKLKENVKSVKEVKYGEFKRAFPNNNGNGARYRIEQLAKDYQAKAANEVLDSSVGQCKAIFANNEVPTDEVSSKGTTELQGVSFISNGNVQVSKERHEMPQGVLPCQLPPKEFNPRSFTLPCTIVLNEWILDSFDMEADFERTHNDPYSSSLHEYKAVFDNEIKQVANKYELRIGKKGYVLDNIWEKCEQVHGGTLYSWHDDGFEGCLAIGTSERGKVQGNDPEADGHRRKCPRRNVDPP